MLIDELQELSEQVTAPFWNTLKESLNSHATLGNREFTFYDKDYMKGSELTSENVYAEPFFTALIEKCKSEGLQPEKRHFNNKVTGVMSATISW